MKRKAIHPKYLLSSKAPVRWVARAGQIDYPKVLWDDLVRWQPRPSFYHLSQQQQNWKEMAEHTCLPERFLGLLSIFIRFNPTPIAPELTRTTLWPWRFKSTTVSTTAESVERRGWWVVSWTIEEVPNDLFSLKKGTSPTIMCKCPPSLITIVQGVMELEFMSVYVVENGKWLDEWVQGKLIFVLEKSLEWRDVQFILFSLASDQHRTESCNGFTCYTCICPTPPTNPS